MKAADQDIANAQVPGISNDWRLNMAHNAILRAAAAALAASGYRPDRQAHHYRLIESLEKTVGLSAEYTGRLNAMRKKRNIASYEMAGVVTDKEANEVIDAAKDICERVETWLHVNYPELMEK